MCEQCEQLCEQHARAAGASAGCCQVVARAVRAVKRRGVVLARRAGALATPATRPCACSRVEPERSLAADLLGPAVGWLW